MPTEKVLCLWKRFRTKSTVTLSPSVSIMTGIREWITMFTFWLQLQCYSDALMEECVRMMQQRLRAAPSKKRAKSVYAHKNLGTIKDKKRERRQEKEKTEADGSDVIMRILRMRYVNVATSGFVVER